MVKFREAATKEFGWREEHFEGKLFLACLEPFPRFLARLLWPWRQRLFGDDINAMRMVADLTHYNDIFQVAQSFGDGRRDFSFLRNTLGIRPRGRRLLGVAREILPGRKGRETKVESAYAPGATWRKEGPGRKEGSGDVGLEQGVDAGASPVAEAGSPPLDASTPAVAGLAAQSEGDGRMVKKPKPSERPPVGISAWRKKPGGPDEGAS